MEWNDEAIVLSLRGLGESSAVLTVLTREHGRHAGLVRGGSGRRARGMLQPGSQVDACWRGRLAEQLGTFTCEPGRPLAPEALCDPRSLAAVAAACAILATAVPERAPVPQLYAHLQALLDCIPADPLWPARYVCWEVDLLAELGWQLDLARCALTGVQENLAFVSPRTGRAVSAAAAEPWADRLLVLPAFLVEADVPVAADDIAAGLALTGHFLLRHAYAEQNRGLPDARARLPEVMARAVRQLGDGVAR